MIHELAAFWSTLVVVYALVLVVLVIVMKRHRPSSGSTGRVGYFKIADDAEFDRIYAISSTQFPRVEFSDGIDLRLAMNDEKRSIATRMCPGYPCYFLGGKYSSGSGEFVSWLEENLKNQNVFS